MYLGEGITKIVCGDLTLSKSVSIEYDYKKIVDRYEDINRNKREDKIGYQIKYTFTYIFADTDTGNGDQSTLREILNSSDIVVITPRIDQENINYECYIELKSDDQTPSYDILVVECNVIEIQSLPRIYDEYIVDENDDNIIDENDDKIFIA